MRVLVLEDDPIVRNSIGRMLRHHEVTLVATPAEAMDACQEEFDFVLSDVDLGQAGSGLDLHDWLETHRPDLLTKFQFMSGNVPFDLQARIQGTGVGVWDKPLGVFKGLQQLTGGSKAA